MKFALKGIVNTFKNTYMTTQQKSFVDGLLRNANSHEDWLTIVQFGLPTLLKDQDVLIEVLMNEAKGISESDPAKLASSLKTILDELGLKFSLTAVG